ncbi:uroporphyrinogen-III synthase [Fodinicola feengrottensis]|uniref:uroporphyrinogen-III synthase n=1 Tax=Fodinicola feengrottensis TaxID=435914 RepID=UPI0028BE2333|nr:uroporphyrinogen-III synthase [Fodinicola feengrottensis]
MAHPDSSTAARDLPPLAGFTVGVTAARRREELTSLLTRRGATVIEAPAVKIVPLADDTALWQATQACLTGPLDYVGASTGIGFRSWLEAADGWGVRADLRERISQARLYARGPKAVGAMRSIGLADVWSPPSESSADMLTRLLAEPLAGRRVVVQEHGAPMPDFTSALRAAGAEVICVRVYRWAPPDDVAPLRKLAQAVASASIDAITFTSAPAVLTLLDVAADSGHLDGMLAGLRGPVAAACVGPICAGPLREHGVECVIPERSRLGALVRVLTDQLSTERTRLVRTSNHELRIRGSAVVVDGVPVRLSQRSAAVLRALAVDPGRVLTRAELLTRAWPDSPGEEHAVETTIGGGCGRRSGRPAPLFRRSSNAAIGSPVILTA